MTANQTPSQPPATPPAPTRRSGDVITQYEPGKGWSVAKVLQVDEFPGHGATLHCLIYATSSNEPTLATLAQLPVYIWHVPMAESAFNTGWTLLGNLPPRQEEMMGFTEYLKLTDFPRYLSFTGQDVKELVGRANALYREACRLGDEGKRTEAIAIYDEVIDIFPLFFEAIDNRAFTHMELGNYQAALAGFEESLRVNPDGLAAFFSRGECLLRLGRLDEAHNVFSEGITRFPEQEPMFRKFLGMVREAQKTR